MKGKPGVARVFVAICSIVFLSCAARGDEGASPFQDIAFDAALKQAQQEHKIVFIDFFTTWCGPCKMLDTTTWKDSAVIALLKEKTIALRVDAEKNADLAKRYPVHAYPTLALIRSDGSLVDTLVGYQDAKTFISNFNSALVGKTSLQRALDAVEQAKPGSLDGYVKARYRLGQALANDGKNAEALVEYLWCYDDGMKKAVGYGGVRLSFLLDSLERLGKQYPPALEAMKERRDQARKAMETSPSDSSSAMDFAGLNHYLGEDPETLAFYDKLPADSPLRSAMGYHVFDLLLETKRYDDAVKVTPYAQFKGQFLMDVIQMGLLPATAAAPMRSYIVTSGAKELEALAGAGKTEDASELLASILKFDKSEQTLDVLKEHLTRAGHPELMPGKV